MPNKALVLVAAAVLEAREKPSTYSARRLATMSRVRSTKSYLCSPRDHDHDRLAPGAACGQRLEAVEDLRNQPGHPRIGHAAGVQDLGDDCGHPGIRHTAGAP
jgi:hypothetical protein